jgi:hypothetical protein
MTKRELLRNWAREALAFCFFAANIAEGFF